MTKRMLVCASIEILIITTGAAQGFQDLDFESAQIQFVSTFVGGGYVAASNAIPGWTAHAGTSELSTVAYNFSAFFPPVGLVGSKVWCIAGTYSVFLGPGGVIGTNSY